MTFRRSALARAQPAPTGGAGLHIGWNWRQTDDIDNGLIDVYGTSTMSTRQTFTNANGDSVDGNWLANPPSVSDSAFGATDPRLMGYVFKQTNTIPFIWQVYCPPGVYKLWCGSGLNTSTNANILVKVYDGIESVGGLPEVEFASGSQPGATFTNMDNNFVSAPVWISDYDSVDVRVTVTDRGGDTGMRLSYELAPGNSFAILQHTRIQQQ